MKIGICGKSGSGKSSLAKLIMDKYPDTVHIDIDKIGHEAYLDHDVLKKMLLTFGVDVLTDSVVDRKKLGKLVFDNPENMQKLTNITLFLEEQLVGPFQQLQVTLATNASAQMVYSKLIASLEK